MLKYSVDRASLLKIYILFIRPILEYANSVWTNCTQQESELLESVQIEAARIVTGLRRNFSRSCLYTELGLEHLQDHRDHHKLTIIFKILSGECPQYLADLIFPYFPAETGYNLRSAGQNLHVPQCLSTSYYNSFLHSTIRMWNSLPNHIKSEMSLDHLEKALKLLKSPQRPLVTSTWVIDLKTYFFVK